MVPVPVGHGARWLRPRDREHRFEGGDAAFIFRRIPLTMQVDQFDIVAECLKPMGATFRE